MQAPRRLLTFSFPALCPGYFASRQRKAARAHQSSPAPAKNFSANPVLKGAPTRHNSARNTLDRKKIQPLVPIDGKRTCEDDSGVGGFSPSKLFPQCPSNKSASVLSIRHLH